MHRVNAGYTLLAPLRPECVQAAIALVAELDGDRSRLQFDASATTHFASLTIIPAQLYRKAELPATLLLATSFCGPTHLHVQELVRIMGPGLREVFAHCQGFAPGCTDEALEAFILANRHSDTFYSGMQHLSPQCVRRHKELRTAIQSYVDNRQAGGGFHGTAREIRREIQDHVRSRPELAWAEEPFAPPPGTWRALHGRSFVVLGFLIALVSCTGLRAAGVTELGTPIAIGWLSLVAFVLVAGALFVAVRVSECA